MHTWYLSPQSPTCRWRRNLPCGEISDFNTWNFSTWRGISVFPHNRCGEMWIFAKFGEISHFSTGQMWRNLKFIQFFVIKSVLRCFCEIRFGAIYALLRGENFCKKLGKWRKNDKYEVWLNDTEKFESNPATLAAASIPPIRNNQSYRPCKPNSHCKCFPRNPYKEDSNGTESRN